MCIFKKKNETPHDRRKNAQKRIKRFSKKRDKLDKNHKYDDDYQEKRKDLNREIATAIDDKKLAESEIKNPKPAPTTVIDNSQRTIKIGSDNTAKAEGKVIAFNKEGEKSSKKPKTITKRKKQKTKGVSKLKLIVVSICVFVLAGCIIFLAVSIKNCIDSHNNAAYVISAIY